MSAFEKIRVETQYNQIVVDYHRDLVRDAMLNRICMFPLDPHFILVRDALCEVLGCTEEYAAMQLWPVSHAIYKAAEAARHE